LLERLAQPQSGDLRVRVPVQLPDELSAVLVAEVERDDVRGELQDVERVPAEVVSRREVELDIAMEAASRWPRGTRSERPRDACNAPGGRGDEGG
jgi:hypothetical protein